MTEQEFINKWKFRITGIIQKSWSQSASRLFWELAYVAPDGDVLQADNMDLETKAEMSRDYISIPTIRHDGSSYYEANKIMAEAIRNGPESNHC